MKKPLPAQIEQMLGRLMDKNERMDVRNNYMNSLLDVRDAINAAEARFKRDQGMKFKERA